MSKLWQMSELIEPYLQHLKAGGRSPNTIRSRGVILRRFAAELPYGLDNAATEELAAILGQYRGWSLYTYYWALSDYFRYVCGGEDPWLDWNPTHDLIRPKSPTSLPDPVSDGELRSALDRSDEWWTTVILLGAKAGLRAAEIVWLDRRDVTEQTIIIRRAKGGSPQAVPTNPELWQRLQDRGDGRVVLNRRGRPIPDGRTLCHSARRHFDRIDMPTVHLHRFRAWYATRLAEEGADAFTVQQCMRHASSRSTEGYVLITEKRRRNAVASLPLLLKARAEY